MKGSLTAEQIQADIVGWLGTPAFRDKRVLVLIPDATRSGPLPLLFRTICEALSGVAHQLDFLVALGTHQPMTPSQMAALVGLPENDLDPIAEGVRIYDQVSIFNHLWRNPTSFAHLGVLSAQTVAEISGGLLSQEVPVLINRKVLEYDHILVCGPVFPHEVVGFSGGNKYFFPGISGPDVINLSHWLGALITSYEIIGKLGRTPVRQFIDAAAALVPTPKSCLAVVVSPDNTNALLGLFYGSMEAAWSQAAALSAQHHIRYMPRPFRQVLSVIPTMYTDIWTAAKGMYKLEPVVADGGEVILYAPHINTFSYTHGAQLAEIGYHVRDYFLKQWDRFKHYSGGVLAHSTHLRGVGTYDPITGENPRIKVTLATQISPAQCAAHNLGYRDPQTISPQAFANREAEGILLVPKAGEMLYRLQSPSPESS
jgi:lactate racemase